MIKRFGDFLKTRAQIMAGTFDPTEVELQALLGSASPSVVSGPDSSVVSGPLSVVGCESDAVEQTGATGDVGPADVCPLEYVPSPDSSAGCDAPHFLRNEAISAHVSGPLSVAHGGALATAEPGLPDSVAVVAGPLAAETAVAAGDASDRYGSQVA